MSGASRRGRRSLSVHWGLVCAFRNTTYRASDYAEPVGDYGLPLNHPRFVEWIGVPQSAGLIELSGRQWVDKLSRDQAVTAAVHLQRMQTNVDVLDQYALSLEKAASRMIDNCLGPCVYPAAEVVPLDLGSAAPQYRWRQWVFGFRPWTPCDYTRMTLVAVHYIWLDSFSFWLPQCWGVPVR